MSNSDPLFPNHIELGSERLPQVLGDLAGVLPKFDGTDLESQLQTFDSFLQVLSAEVRPEVGALLQDAAQRTENVASRKRIEEAARSVLSGGSAAKPYDHAKHMREYASEHAAQYAPKAVRTRQVEYREYATRVRGSGAVMTVDKPGGIGETERWEMPDGRLVGYVRVRYFRGENEYDYYVCDE